MRFEEKQLKIRTRVLTSPERGGGPSKTVEGFPQRKSVPHKALSLQLWAVCPQTPDYFFIKKK